MSELFGVDQVTVKNDATLIFSHPAVPQGPLYIHSGANAIKWAYTLNTQSTPTIGGEVVQVLSAFVGPMQIAGQTAGLKVNKTGQLESQETRGWKSYGALSNWSPNHELEAIVQWFRAYMEVAGSTTNGNQRRDERAVHFLYPTRGWDFYIIPTAIQGFRYDREVISPEWSITAEVISDNALNFFAGMTMSSFNDNLITNQPLIGLSAFAQSGTETNNPAFGQTGDAGSTDPFLNPQIAMSATQVARKMGDNFQALVAAWSGGSFADFGFGALLDNGTLPKNVDQVYANLFGNSFLAMPGAGQASAGGVAGGAGTYTYSGSSAKDAVAAQIANAFSGAGVPPVLGIAIALHESGLNPDTNVADTNGARSVGLFQGNLKGRVANVSQAIAAGQHPNDPTTKWYPAVQQISDAVKWIGGAKPAGNDGSTNDELAQWAFAAQDGTGYTNGDTVSGSCTTLFAGQIAQAKQILATLSASTSSNTGNAAVSASAQTARQFYKNPFRDIQGLTALGIDQGVDYGGQGPVYALGRAKIVTVTSDWFSVNGSPYPGIGYVLLDGPAAGKGVYFAENITPLVKVGQVVDSSTAIATLSNSYPYCEMGWAQSGTSTPMSPLMSNIGANHDPKSYGVNFCQLLVALGCPAAGAIPSSTPDPPIPSNWPRWS